MNGSTLVALACRETNWCQGTTTPNVLRIPIHIIVAVGACLALAAVLGNGLFIVVYYRKEALQTPSNTALVGLAVTDFLSGAVALPLFLYEKILVLTNCAAHFCVIVGLTKAVTLYVLGATICFLSVMSLDRYVAIFYGLRYYDLVTNSRVSKVLLATGLGWTGLFVASRAFAVNIALPSAAVFFSNVVLVAVVNFKIFRQIRRLESNDVVANEAEAVRQKRERKTTKAVGVIIGALLCCFLPLIAVAAVRLSIASVKKHVFTDTLLLWVAVLIAMSNSSLNWFIYCWQNSDIRAAMLKVIRSALPQFGNEINPS